MSSAGKVSGAEIMRRMLQRRRPHQGFGGQEGSTSWHQWLVVQAGGGRGLCRCQVRRLLSHLEEIREESCGQDNAASVMSRNN